MSFSMLNVLVTSKVFCITTFYISSDQDILACILLLSQLSLLESSQVEMQALEKDLLSPVVLQ